MCVSQSLNYQRPLAEQNLDKSKHHLSVTTTKKKIKIQLKKKLFTWKVYGKTKRTNQFRIINEDGGIIGILVIMHIDRGDLFTPNQYCLDFYSLNVFFFIIFVFKYILKNRHTLFLCTILRTFFSSLQFSMCVILSTGIYPQ